MTSALDQFQGVGDLVREAHGEGSEILRILDAEPGGASAMLFGTAIKSVLGVIVTSTSLGATPVGLRRLDRGAAVGCETE